MTSTQTLELGASAERVRETVQRLQAQRYMERLWAYDASLWSTDPQAQAAIRDRLGWLASPQRMAHHAATLSRFAQELRGAGFSRVLLLGMGGSGLFAEVCQATVASTTPIRTEALNLTVLDTTDPTAIRTQQQRGPLEQLCLLISSKSGTTREITSLAAYFHELLKAAVRLPGAQCVVITDAGTPLEAQAKAWGVRRAFVHEPGTGADVGGRFSALTYFGLVPAALCGLDVSLLLSRAEEMLGRCAPTAPAAENPGLWLGAVLGTLAQEGRNKLTLLAPAALASVGSWVEQLVAESTGKAGRGIVPICGEPLLDPRRYGSDRLFVELQLAAEPDTRIAQQARLLAQTGAPVVRIEWHDRYDLGGEVIRWSIATTIAGSLLGVNPFDEPNVQESKDRTNTLLARYAQEHHLPADSPLFLEDNLTVYGSLPSGSVRSLPQSLTAFLQQRRPGDYLAVLSFLPRMPALDEAVHALRATLAVRSGCATMAQFGPRYLHSTGQLFKGGADSGLFLLLTGEDPADLPVPGEPFTFSVLKHAQAQGDFQAMQEKGRRILRVHLRADLPRAMQRLIRAVEHVTIPGAPIPPPRGS